MTTHAQLRAQLAELLLALGNDSPVPEHADDAYLANLIAYGSRHLRAKADSHGLEIAAQHRRIAKRCDDMVAEVRSRNP